jgi:sec-independent protein translocase protein TatA
LAYENVITVVMLLGAVFFGAERLPELARSLGKAQSEFEKARIETLRSSTSNNAASVAKTGPNRQKLEAARQ